MQGLSMDRPEGHFEWVQNSTRRIYLGPRGLGTEKMFKEELSCCLASEALSVENILSGSSFWRLSSPPVNRRELGGRSSSPLKPMLRNPSICGSLRLAGDFEMSGLKDGR